MTPSHQRNDRYEQLHRDIVSMQPRLRSRAPQARELRHVPKESIQELQEMGFFLALQPKRYGGLELAPSDFFKLQIALAEGCMSTAWASGIIAVHAFQLALMDERAQQDVWGDDIHTRMSSSYAPWGKVERVEGGFQLSGRWGWSSGCQHCQWVLLGAIVPDEGYRTFLLPISDYRIEDTWQSMGLQGTGSHDIVVEGAFVPDYRTHKQMDGFLVQNPGQSVNPQPLYQIPWAQLFIRTVSSPAIGACKAAIQLAINGAQNAASADPTKLAGDVTTHERIAAAICGVDEIEALIERNFTALQTAIAEQGQATLEQRALYRYQAAQVISRCKTIIDSLFANAGGRSVFLGSEIQQIFLDINTARAHVANNPTAFARNFGAMNLGLDNKDFFI